MSQGPNLGFLSVTRLQLLVFLTQDCQSWNPPAAWSLSQPFRRVPLPSGIVPWPLPTSELGGRPGHVVEAAGSLVVGHLGLDLVVEVSLLRPAKLLMSDKFCFMFSKNLTCALTGFFPFSTVISPAARTRGFISLIKTKFRSITFVHLM